MQQNLIQYATKFDSKGGNMYRYIKFSKMSDLANIKSIIDRLDIDKLETMQVGLNKLSNRERIMLLKKTLYGELFKK